jgi:hypothetical protein
MEIDRKKQKYEEGTQKTERDLLDALKVMMSNRVNGVSFISNYEFLHYNDIPTIYGIYMSNRSFHEYFNEKKIWKKLARLWLTSAHVDHLIEIITPVIQRGKQIDFLWLIIADYANKQVSVSIEHSTYYLRVDFECVGYAKEQNKEVSVVLMLKREQTRRNKNQYIEIDQRSSSIEYPPHFLLFYKFLIEIFGFEFIPQNYGSTTRVEYDETKITQLAYKIMTIPRTYLIFSKFGLDEDGDEYFTESVPIRNKLF